MVLVLLHVHLCVFTTNVYSTMAIAMFLMCKNIYQPTSVFTLNPTLSADISVMQFSNKLANTCNQLSQSNDILK